MKCPLCGVNHRKFNRTCFNQVLDDYLYFLIGKDKNAPKAELERKLKNSADAMRAYAKSQFGFEELYNTKLEK